MKLILKFDQGVAAPSACCEVCNVPITDANLATVYWRLEDFQKGTSEPLLVRKACMPMSRCTKEKYDCSMEFSAYLVFLLRSLGSLAPTEKMLPGTLI